MLPNMPNPALSMQSGGIPQNAGLGPVQMPSPNNYGHGPVQPSTNYGHGPMGAPGNPYTQALGQTLIPNNGSPTPWGRVEDPNQQGNFISPDSSFNSPLAPQGPGTQQMAQYGPGGMGSFAASAGASTSPSQATSSYPAYPNAFGLGDSSSFTQQPNFQPPQSAVSNPTSYGSQPLGAATTPVTNTGMNPWSMTGEANSRP